MLEQDDEKLDADNPLVLWINRHWLAIKATIVLVILLAALYKIFVAVSLFGGK